MSYERLERKLKELTKPDHYVRLAINDQLHYVSRAREDTASTRIEHEDIVPLSFDDAPPAFTQEIDSSLVLAYSMQLHAQRYIDDIILQTPDLAQDQEPQLSALKEREAAYALIAAGALARMRDLSKNYHDLLAHGADPTHIHSTCADYHDMNVRARSARYNIADGIKPFEEAARAHGREISPGIDELIKEL